MQNVLTQSLKNVLKKLEFSDVPVILERPADPIHGDFATNIALIAAKKLGKNPRVLADEIVTELGREGIAGVEKVAVAGAGFINFYLSSDFLLKNLQKILENDELVPTGLLKDKKIMIEYAHPNTHKEMHIGHMRTLITGEALARILQACGATVFRANYQGDIGPHVAKALWGIEQLMAERNLSLEIVGKWPHAEKAHFLGEGYAKGSQEYEENKDEIDRINTELYQHVGGGYISDKKNHLQRSDLVQGPTLPESRPAIDLYQLTRQWSLDYYNDFYKRFYTRFDHLFFESDMVTAGKDIVEENIGTVFKKENGAVIFPGVEYGLHTRVFITQKGNPTYEGKEMGNGFAEERAFPFDLKVHVVASEQAGYFQVVFKALELIDPEKFKNKQHHVSMGMVTLTDRKMSSRTGDVLTVDWLLDQVKGKVEELFSGDRVSSDEKGKIAEEVTIGAVKHSVLRVGTTQNVAFSIEKSVSVEGDSGPYLQYTYVRTQSILKKSHISHPTFQKDRFADYRFEPEEMALLRQLAIFHEVIEESAIKYNPSILASYLFELAQTFNNFYQKLPILKEEDAVRDFRLGLTEAVGKQMKQGLNLLGIKAPEKM